MLLKKYLHDIAIHAINVYYDAPEIDLSGTFAPLMYPQEFSLLDTLVVRNSITAEVISFARSKVKFFD